MPYLNVGEVESALVVASSAPFSAFTTLITLPNLTWEARQSRAIKLGNGSGLGRPAVFLLGGVHAREWGSADILINFVEQLEQAYQAGTGLAFGSQTFSGSDIQTVVDTLDLIVFPQVNPDGREQSMTGDAMWRKNRRVDPPNSAACRGVDINRNFDFVWDFPTHFSALAVPPASTDPCDDEVYCGPAAFSEPETRNVKWLIDSYPNIRAFIDLHSFGQTILYSWGDDESQSVDPAMNFRNPAYDGQLGVGGDTYGEYVPPADRTAAVDLANTMRVAIQAVRGSAYTVRSSFSLYPTSGASDDYGYSRHFVDLTKENVIAFTVEWGSPLNPTPFHPPYAEMQRIIEDITCGLIAFCLKVCEQEESMSWQLTGNSSTAPATDFVGTKDNQPLVVKTNGAERMRVNADGNVGIGTSNPGAKLEINNGDLLLRANAEDPGDIVFQNAAGAQKARIWSNPGAGAALFLSSGDNNPDITVAANGNVGIGTTQPGNKFSVVGGSPDFYALLSTNTGGGAIAGRATTALYPAVVGLALGAAAGVHGYASQTTVSSIGVVGTVGNGAAPYLVDAVRVGGVGVLGSSIEGTGVVGITEGTGAVGNGVEGIALAGSGCAVVGQANVSTAVAVQGQNAVAGGKAAHFIGNVDVVGTFTTSGKGFRIDHPLDPAGKYLTHSSIESPDMMNVYNGNITTDRDSEAVVELPGYFEALNRDFRYQLTVIGDFAQAIVAREVEGNRFVIRTDRPNVKVSWQVTGVRKDPYAESHRILAEEQKPDTERGRYLHPELYATPATTPEMRRPIGWIPDMLLTEGKPFAAFRRRVVPTKSD